MWARFIKSDVFDIPLFLGKFYTFTVQWNRGKNPKNPFIVSEEHVIVGVRSKTFFWTIWTVPPTEKSSLISDVLKEIVLNPDGVTGKNIRSGADENFW